MNEKSAQLTGVVKHVNEKAECKTQEMHVVEQSYEKKVEEIIIPVLLEDITVVFK